MGIAKSFEPFLTCQKFRQLKFGYTWKDILCKFLRTVCFIMHSDTPGIEQAFIINKCLLACLLACLLGRCRVLHT